MIIDPSIESALLPLIGKPCCRQRVGRRRSLSVGFGKKIPHSSTKTADPFYGEWEIGAYSSAWRIIRDGRVACGSSDVVDSIDELDERMRTIALGSIIAIEASSLFDIRVRLSNNVLIDFLCTFSDDDEMFHIFGPDHLYVDYTSMYGWKLGKSNTPST